MIAGFGSGEGSGTGARTGSACWIGSLGTSLGSGWKENGVGWTGLRNDSGRGLVPAEKPLGADVGENLWAACRAGWCTSGRGSSTKVNGVGEGRREWEGEE